MHCPKCGLEEVSGETRFCRACRFELEDVKVLLVPEKLSESVRERRTNSAFNQGLALLLTSLVLVIVMTLLRDLDLVPQFVVKLVAAIFVLAGLFRMFLPYVFTSPERRSRVKSRNSTANRANTSKLSQLPPVQTIPVTDWNPRDPAAVVDVPSITEHTTRKLAGDK